MPIRCSSWRGGSREASAAKPNNNRIQKFDSAGTFLTTWGDYGSGNGQFAGPTSVAVDGSGNVYVSDTDNYRIQKFDSTGAFEGTWGGFGQGNGQFSRPTGVAVDGSGNVYVGDVNRIEVFDKKGTFLTAWASAGYFVAVDGAGNVYARGVSYDCSIYVFDGTGAFKGLYPCGSGGSGDGQFIAYGVAVGGSGIVYVTDNQNNRIEAFAGYGVQTFTAGTPSGSNITSSPPGSGTDVTLSSVSSPGTTLITVSPSGQTLPIGLQLGNPPVYYYIATTATYTSPVTVCINYSSAQYSDPSTAELLHFEGGNWVNVTISNDVINSVICGQTSSLSPFAIAQKSAIAPVISWTPPTAITYGTALSSAQLNATANVPGTFAYSPAAGTVLNPGAGQTLSVTFTPTEAIT